MVVCTSRFVKMKERFVDKSAYFVLKIQLLLRVLSNFEREATLKDSAF